MNNLTLKIVKLGVIGLLVIIWSGLWLAAGAQTELTATPGQLTINANQNQSPIITRTLLLRSSQTLTELQFISLDLVRADNGAILPAANIRASQTITQLTANEPFTLPLVFDLRPAPSGEFSGEFLINHATGSLSIPLTVRLKDFWLGPLGMLVLGVGLGLLVSLYRTQGKPRDELLVRLGQVRTESQADQELAPSFRSQLEAHLLTAQSALQARDWNSAQTAVQQAETLWLKWRANRVDWLEQLAYAAELLAADELQAPNSRYLKTLVRDLKAAVRDAPGLSNPAGLNQILVRLADQFGQYLQLRSEIEELNALPHVSAAQQNELAQLQKQLDAILPEDTDQYDQLQQALSRIRTEILAQLSPEIEAQTLRSAALPTPGLPVPVPTLSPLGQAATGDENEVLSTGAKRRLEWFRWGSYAIAILLLAGAGFSELYLARPTFGDNPWNDYFALLLWGFGAEASRAAITNVLRALEVPGLR